MKVLNFFGKSQVGGRRVVWRSIDQLLRTVLTKTQCAAAASATKDTRLLLQEAAHILSISEVDLLTRISAKTRMACAQTVKPVDVRLLSLTLGELWEAGAIPALKNGVVAAVICSDPARAAAVFAHYPQAAPCLGSWFGIAQALDASERMLRQIEHEHAVVTDKQRETVSRAKALQVFRFVVSEVTSHGAESFSLEREGSDHFYSFETKSKVRGRGTIHASAWDELVELVERLASELNRERSQNGLCPLRVVRSAGVTSVCWGADDARCRQIFELQVDQEKRTRQPTPTMLTQRGARIESSSARVLIVDDEPVFTKVLGRFLSRHNIQAVHVHRPQDALEMLGDPLTPTVLICDLHMPEMSGDEIVHKARRELKLADLPIIMLTAEDDVETELSLIDGGADLFISKSADPRVLVAHIRRFIERNDHRRVA